MSTMAAGDINDLPDRDFAYIEPGGSKDDEGKTTPRSKRHFPIPDAAHVRNALARIAQGAQFGDEALPKVRAAAKKFGVDVSKGAAPVLETKTFEFKIDGEPDGEGKFTGYAAVFGNVDRGNDVIEPGACTKTLQENPEVPLFWQHDYKDIPIGVGTLTPDPRGVKIEGQLFIDSSDRAREVYGAMKAKAVKGLSIGYNTFKRTFKSGVRHLQEIGIGEVSLCNTPMNQLALVDGVKAGKYLPSYDPTDTIHLVQSIVTMTTDYLASEIAEGDDDDVARLKTILPLLMQCLTSEINDLETGGLGQQGGDEDDGPLLPVEGMSADLNAAVENLKALFAGSEPAGGHSGSAGAASGTGEPDGKSTLAALESLTAGIAATVAR